MSALKLQRPWLYGAAALVVATAAIGLLTRAPGVQSGDGITSTTSGRFLGGGTATTFDVETLGAGADLVVEATVIDVEPVRMNTPSGTPGPVDPGAGPGQLQGQYPETPVRLRVENVWARRTQMSREAAEHLAQVRPGDEIVITVAGGEYQYTFSREEARILGIETVPPEAEGDAEDEAAANPDGPTTATTAVQPSTHLVENQRAVFFLAAQAEQWRTSIRLVGEGQGAFVFASGARSARQAVPGGGTTVTLEDLRRIAARVERERGPALSLDAMQRGEAGR